MQVASLSPVLRKIAIVAGLIAGGLVAFLLTSLIVCYLLIPTTPQHSPIAEKLARYLITDIFKGAQVQFDNLTLMRGTLKEPIALRADAIRLYAASASTKTEPAMESLNFLMKVSPFSVLTGQATIDAITIDSVKLVAQRDVKGRYRFGLAGEEGAAPGNTKRAPLRPLAVLDRIDNLHINSGVFILEDLATKQSETIASLNITLKQDPAFDQTLVTATARDSADAEIPVLDFVLTTTKAEKNAEIILYFNKLDLTRLTPFIPAWNRHITLAEGAFSGEVRLQYNKNTDILTDYKIALEGTGGRLQLADIMLRPMTFDALSLGFTKDGLSLNGQIDDNPFAIQTRKSQKPGGGYDVKADIPQLDLKALDGTFKEGKDSVAQEWFTEKLKDGRIKDVRLDGWLHRDTTNEWTMSDVVVDFAVEDMWVLYKLDMAPVEHLYATGRYENDTLSLKMDKGVVSGMTVVEGELNFADLTKAGKGDCQGLLRLTGTLPSVLNYLDNPIIRYKERVAVDLTKASGSVTMSLGLDFPTTKDAKMEEIKVDVDAVLTNANLPDVVSGITLTGGPLAVKASADKVLLRGDVRLNQAPSYLTYETYFSPENAPFTQKLDLRGNMTQATLNEFGLGDWVRNMKTSSRYTLSYIDPVTGIPSVKAHLTGNDFSVQNAAITLSAKNEFIGAKLDGLVMGATKGNASVSRNKNGGYNFDFSGSTFDARPVLSPSTKSKDSKSPAHLNASVKATRLITSDQGAINNVNIAYASNGRGDTSKLNLSGMVGGQKANINFNEGARGDTLRVDILDAGAFLRAMDVTSGVKGGEINVEASPNGAYGSMKGRARIKNFTAREVPLLGRLINALSLPGLFQLFTNEGIAFERLRSDFTWEKAKNGDSVLRLQNGATRGSSLGLTFEGSYNQTRKNLDVKGKVVPLSGVNNIVKSIPLLGPLLSGGRDGALVAANYTIAGSTDDPRVFINPLSILTPGLLRTILFESEGDNRATNDNTDDAKPARTYERR